MDTLDLLTLAHLKSIRLVQILERRGVKLDFFLAAADDGLVWLSDLDSSIPGNQANFFDEIRKRHSNMVAMKDKDTDVCRSDDLLFHMAAAKLDPSEPYYAEQRRNFVKKNVDKMRDKVRC